MELLKELGKIAQEVDARAYVIGGFVRNHLMGKSQDDVDIDLVVDGQTAEVVANQIARHMRSKVILHPRFKTATLSLGYIKIDIATARLESYPGPAVLPVVEITDLENDLQRRDFTINAVAMSLTPHNFGKIIDLFWGCQDLE